MKNLIAFFLVFFLFLTTINAKIWRVSNRPAVDADFTTILDAHNAASIGDTIYVGGSPITYAGLTISKTLTIIGPGHSLDQNPNTLAYKENANTRTITINTGANNTILMGLTIQGLSILSRHNIIIKRCRLSGGFSVPALSITNSRNITVEQCRISGVLNTSRDTNLMIRNNYLSGLTFDNSSDAVETAIYTTLQNNVIRGSGYINARNVNIINNIIKDASYTGLNNLVSHNIADGTQFGTGSGNQANVDMETVFEGVLNQGIVQSFRLKAGSPAVGAGANGGDCGMFSADSGGNPYILSGLPAIPAIHEITVPDAGSNTLNINVKSMTHN